MSSAEGRQVVVHGLAAERRIVIVIEVALPRRETAAREAAALIAGPQVSAEVFARAIPVDGQQCPADRVGEHPIPAARRAGQSPGRGRIDRDHPVQLGGEDRSALCRPFLLPVHQLAVHQREHRHGDLDARSKLREQSFFRVMPRRSAGQDEIGEQVRAQLIDRAVVEDALLRLGTPRPRVLLPHGIRHLGEPVVHPVHERRGATRAELGHAVLEIGHPDAAQLPGVTMSLDERPLLEPVGQSAHESAYPVRRFRSGHLDRLRRETRTIVGVVEVSPRLHDHACMRGADPPGALSLPDGGEPFDQPRRIGHPPLDRAVAHALRGPDLRGDRADRHVCAVRMPRLPGDVDRQSPRHREQSVAGRLHAAQ
ncbi:unnamed protein product, partial [Penicillium discolor]